MLFTSPEMWEIVPTAKRYLVEVEGIEKLFVLEPIHEDLLGRHPESRCDGGCDGVSAV